VSPKEVTDGESNTLMAGEVKSRFKPWGDPTNWRDPSLGINRSPDGFGGPFEGGASFLFVDGSVRFIKNTIDPSVLKALSTPQGGERVSSEQY
jgi:prepilin-type processing-associated H-X9-DG protein